MAKNRLKETEEAVNKPPTKKKKKKQTTARRGLKFGFLRVLAIDEHQLVRNLPFFFFLTFLGVIYIANAQFAIRTVKEISRLQEQLKREGWDSNSRKSELMYESMQSRIAEKVFVLGLRTLSDKPKKIEVRPEDYEMPEVEAIPNPKKH